ncbi:2-hydroxychromene-2-carboxylate isomerase [Ottowia sp.]|uniref:2-hydroxychromene-2-carboxylate isomerase n=1 Tax=Ottowia sp. TaxID=1898956 RepID=UPI002CCF1F2A|nr:2-hydroxychromene-2-carboxylate isomerase [Ottowia sp.]HRN76547.1 2-hydroxychromene-2-carboxylate isomerase [Ottowia sp.]HRQ03086.1 2-hydroxychromene-2-carboxylate isomerase [Ottowia sp.]
MKRIDCYLDFISPYAYLAFEQLPRALEGLGYEVTYRPVLFAGLLKQHGQLGPAEIAPKRDWTYRQVLWLAQQHGIAMQLPAAHPFNPLGLLRLAWACARQGAPSRYVCETIFHHVWRSGAGADDAARMAALSQVLAPARDPAGDEARQALRDATDAALRAGVFGVPSFVVDGRLFWGFDALPMLRAQLAGDAVLDKIWQAADRVSPGIRRRAPD